MIEGKNIAITRSKDDSQEFIDLITRDFLCNVVLSRCESTIREDT